MYSTPFCRAEGAPRLAAILNKISDALYGVEGPGLARLADDKLHLLVEGGKWKGCWSQNYFGMICTTPLLSGKLLDYHLHTLELFFELQGDGVRKDENGFTAPRCLCYSDMSHLYSEKLDMLHDNRIDV